MQKKKINNINKIIITSIIILIIILIYLIGYAYAKFSSLFKGEVSKQVAKWSFKVNNSLIEQQTFDLVNTINKITSVQNDKVAPRNKWLF